MLVNVVVTVMAVVLLLMGYARLGMVGCNGVLKLWSGSVGHA
jgi:hypothetical protein